MTTATPRTNAAMAQTLDEDHELNETHRHLIALCRELETELAARALAAPAALIVPPDVMRAAERMAKPLHESRLSGATAEEDARCAWLVLSFLRAHEEPK